ncbi:uncharacterized protein LOC135387849 [Ornithodoros turicata]
MSICRPSAFSTRTKSLREKFASKRSYSESFKDPPPAAAADLSPRPTLPAVLPPPMTSGLPCSGEPPSAPSHHSATTSELTGFLPSYGVFPEDAYCSALDINSQEGDPRFPWQRDAAIQCDLKTLPSSRLSSSSSSLPTSDNSRGALLFPGSGKAAQSPAAASRSELQQLLARSAPLEASGAPPTPPPRKSAPALQRALSLERSAGRKKASALGGLPTSQACGLDEGGRLYVPHHVQTLTPSPEGTSSPQRVRAAPSSAPSSRSSASPGDTTPPLSRRPSAAERRKMCFVRKQTNSAPNSMEEDSQSPSPSSSFCSATATTSVSVSACTSRSGSGVERPERPGYFNFESMQRLLDLSMNASSSGGDRKGFFLEIPTQEGLGTCRDGKAAYLSLPSPNLQTEEQENNLVFKKLSNKAEDEDEQDEFVEPPASALQRRRALVPPKMLTDGYESSNEDATSQGSVSHDQGVQKTRRRSSIVVIPPMQICPGDLLVYSKVLTHRNTLLDIDGSTQCLAVTEDSNRKGKNTWSLLRLFDRANRAQSECLGGLEEVLSTLRPSEFCDEQLSKYKGMQWADFVSMLTDKRSNEDDDSASSSGDSRLVSPENGGNSPVEEQQQQETSQGSPTEDALRNQFLKTINQTILKNETKKKEAMWDLFQSECMFLYDHLMVLKNVFMEPLKKIQVEGYAMFAEPEVLFGNLDELCCVTYAFCKEFISFVLQCINAGELNTTDVLIRLFRKSTKATALRQAYHRYTLNYINALNYLETLRRQVEFNEFEKWCSRDPRCKKLQLTDLLVSPVQHIMRVPLILKEIEMRTEDPEERDSIVAILEAEENSLRELDDKMKWLKNFERLLEIQRNIIWPSVTELDPKAFIPEFLKTPLAKQPCERLIVSPRRQIVLEGALSLLDSGKASEVYVVLFDDMILITRRKKGLHKKKSSITENWANTCSKSNSIHEGGYKYVVYKQPLSLDRICIHDVTAQNGSANNLKNAFVFVCLNRFQQIITVHTFQAPNESVKLTWLTKLKDTVDRWKRTLQNTVFRNQRIPPNSSVK